MKKLLLIFFLLLISIIHYPLSSFALSELEKIEQELTEFNKALKLSVDATKPLEKSLTKLEADLKQIQNSISRIDADLLHKKQQILSQELELDEKLTILSEKVYQFYKRTVSYNPFFDLFFGVGSFGGRLREMAYRQSVANHDKQVITGIVLFVNELEEKKAALEADLQTLARLRKKTDEQAEFFRAEIKGAKAYQEELQGKIAALTTRQQEILSARSGTYITSVGEVPLSDDPNASPNFDPGFSPAHGAFSFGAYSHWAGMSQYGAFGRAKSGQNAEQILSAYYQGTELKKDYSMPLEIDVVGYGRIPFENNYLLGIYEVPEKWGEEGGFEALKAQAVAARSFALSSSQPICTTQSCQVYKPQLKSGKWKEAVEQTRGWVLVKDGSAARTYYSSTTGGFTQTKWGWTGIVDTEGGSAGNWPDKAYEKLASSPWFYKGWYTADYYNSSAKCGRSHPWLSESEFVDILNAWVVRQKGSGEDAKRVLPETIKSCSIGGSDATEPFNKEEMRAKAESLGGAYSSVSAVSTSHSGDGITTNVHLNTNRGGVDISGSEFKEAFNLRAPGYISIRSKLYNIERK